MGTSADKPKGYIVSPWFDWVFFLFPPILALGLGWGISGTDFSDASFGWWGWEVTWAGLLIGIFIHAHLVLVFLRSHANREIFRLHKARFLLIPALLYLGMISSDHVLITASVVGTFWDVYHSGMQTFGFGRIYDAKAGNDPKAGRRLDWALNQLLYAGPIVAGATMIDHFEDFEEFESVGVLFFSEVPAWMEGNQAYFTWALIGGGAGFLIVYVHHYVQLARKGHAVSWQKVFLYTSTGAVSLYAWGFNSWGEAFFIMNFFHALQYFGIVWAMEKKTMLRGLRLEGTRGGKWLVLALFIALPLLYGTWVQYLDTQLHSLWAITLVVSLMHFWYDGFVWSVRKRQV
ncbi:hypothetical protein G6O69_02435 [Pseudenhygromyxa sp. WMMC2535]|uniref:hypothetical protein n=1 Tax=Pseudenhygromyxa sp. WMMC2535 TaxID=2712867 RepID=UPI001557CC35|nr:hypothetical protein [Pseudenhygromyxa sp. WMMC2535]NVB36672.1 hypothetical protein [Pseudenhygromyxa sp. WMMC2535]